MNRRSFITCVLAAPIVAKLAPFKALEPVKSFVMPNAYWYYYKAWTLADVADLMMPLGGGHIRQIGVAAYEVFVAPDCVDMLQATIDQEKPCGVWIKCVPSIKNYNGFVTLQYKETLP